MFPLICQQVQFSYQPHLNVPLSFVVADKTLPVVPSEIKLFSGLTSEAFKVKQLQRSKVDMKLATANSFSEWKWLTEVPDTDIQTLLGYQICSEWLQLMQTTNLIC